MFLEMRVAGSVLHAQVSGDLCLKEAREFFARMMREYARGGAKCILIDCRRLRGTLGVMERYELGVQLYQGHVGMIEAGNVPPQIALVAVPPLFDPGMLMESVAVNRGARFRAVQTLDEAAQWLGVDPSSLSSRATRRTRHASRPILRRGAKDLLSAHSGPARRSGSLPTRE